VVLYREAACLQACLGVGRSSGIRPAVAVESDLGYAIIAQVEPGSTVRRPKDEPRDRAGGLVKKTTWIVIAAVVLLGWMAGHVAAQDDADLTMQVSIGYDGYCRTDAWCPVYVVLSNDGPDVEGELVMPAGASGGASRTDTYVKQIVLPARSRKAYFLYFPPPGSSTSSRLTVKLRAGKEEIASKNLSVRWLDASERLYGVAGSDPAALGFLANVAPVGGKAMVARVELASLSPEPLAWEGLDVLVLNDVDTTALSGEQQEALETWVAQGGHLIVGGGAGAALTAAGVADLLPVTVGGARSVSSLQALGEHVEAPLAVGPYAVAETVLRDGEVLIAQDDLILLARRTYGAGQVDFVAFDAGLNPFVNWDDAVRLWEWIVGAGASDAQRLVIRNGYSALEAVNALPGRGLPSTLHILGFLVVYALLIGPVNYVILRKLDRRELAWVTIPMLILGFSACAYVTGFQLRGFDVIVHRLSVMYVPKGSQIGRVNQLVGVFSPRRAAYDVQLLDAQVRAMPGDYSYYGGLPSQALEIVGGAEGVTVSDLRVDVGGIEPFLVEGYAEVPAVEADLRLVDRGGGAVWLEGKVRNGGVALKDAVVIAWGSEQRLGDLGAGKEVTINLPFLGSGAVGGYTALLPDRIIGTSSYWDDPDLSRRYMFLQALFDPYASPYGGVVPGGADVLEPGVYLVGWTVGDNPLSLDVVGRPHTSVDMGLYVYDLPLAAPELGATGAVPPDLVRREVIETIGQVEGWPEGFYIGHESEITFRFTWSALEIREIEELVLVMQGVSLGSTTSPPRVSLWNREIDDWDGLGVDWGENVISDVEPYVIASGGVLVRLESGVQAFQMEKLTITVKGKW
jgi:hypothetical protein